MEDDDFRTVAGELTVNFLDPAAIFLGTPVLLYVGLIAAAVTFAVPAGWFPLDAMLIVTLAATAFSRYAIPARDGVLDADWISPHTPLEASLQFALRYLVLTLLWVVPLAGALVLSIGVEPPTGPAATPFTGLPGVLMVLIVFLLATGPTLACLAAAASNDIRDLFRAELWETLIEARESIVILLAATWGGIAAFWIVYGLPMMLLVVAGFWLAPQMGNALLYFTIALPFMFAPILVGRLAGALTRIELAEALGLELARMPVGTTSAQPVAPNPSLKITAVESANEPEPTPETDSGSDSENQTQTPEVVWAPPPPGSEEARAAFEQMLQKVAAATPVGMRNAVTLAENLARARPTDPYSAGEVALLHVKDNDSAAACEAASRAISRAVALGAADVAAHVYKECRESGPDLPAPLVKSLLPLLTRSGHIDAAHALLVAQGLLTQERSKSLAVAAFKAGDRELTLSILDAAAQRWPDAAFVDALLARMQRGSSGA